jgi:ubiquitin carboxyl-terminal hydrolase 1
MFSSIPRLIIFFRFPSYISNLFRSHTHQALASLSNLPPYLLGICTRAEALDVPTPVVDAHIDLFAALNTPTPTGQPLRVLALVEALCAPLPSLSSSDSSAPSSASSPSSPSSLMSVFWDACGPAPHTSSARANTLLASHQDTQELFQLLSEAMREDPGVGWCLRSPAPPR